MPKKMDLKGMRFGNLTVIKEGERKKQPNGKRTITWECKCDCGKITSICSYSLNKGITKSCGCLVGIRASEQHTTHGKSSHWLYSRRSGMIHRCTNPNNKRYQDYGGRGIKVCDEWLKSFDVFYEWAINNNAHNSLQIDRIDNDGDYSPDNCKWVTALENSSHKRTRKMSKLNTSGVIGVTWDKKQCKWTARIRSNGKRIYIGSFIKKQDAINSLKKRWAFSLKEMTNDKIQ